MSFWDGVKAVGRGIQESMKARQERIMHYKELFERFDDERLLREYRTSSGEKKIACALLLKERGCGNVDE